MKELEIFAVFQISLKVLLFGILRLTAQFLDSLLFIKKEFKNFMFKLLKCFNN